MFKEDTDETKRLLVKSGIDIFQKFESQFTRVTERDETGWKGAMEKLAKDAVGRIISYYKANFKKEEEFSTSLITKGVILGESKRYTHAFLDMPRLNKGFNLKIEDSKASTAGLFDKVGLVAKDTNGEIIGYYEKKDNSKKYGFRLLLEWEDKVLPKEEVAVNGKQYTFLGETIENEYEYLLRDESLEKKQKEILGKIKKDENQDQNKDLDIEQIMQDFGEDFLDKLEKNIDKNFVEFAKVISKKIDEMKKEIKEWFQQEINKVLKNQDKMLENQQKADQDLQILLGRQKAKEKQQIWFDVRDPVQSFTALSPGRQDTLDQVASSIQQGMVVISGLGGIGKSELAIKYAHNHYNKNQQDNIIWINTETRQTMEESFHRLYKKLGFKIEDGEDKDIKLIVKDIYEHFADGKSLFIFDNAEGPDSVSEVLQTRFELSPKDNKPNILITSRYAEWKNVKVLELGELEKEEAIKFIKDYLKLEGTSQDEDIEKLASSIQYFPLVLQQAVAYIEDEKITNKGFGIKDYLEIYKNSKAGLMELLSSDAFKSIDNTYKDTVLTTWKVTLNKIESDPQYGKKALEILDIMSYLVPDNISREVFSKLANGDKELAFAVRLLVKYSMINSIKEGQEALRACTRSKEYDKMSILCEKYILCEIHTQAI